MGFIYYWSLKVLSLRHNNLNTRGFTYKRVQKKKEEEEGKKSAQNVSFFYVKTQLLRYKNVMSDDLWMH